MYLKRLADFVCPNRPNWWWPLHLWENIGCGSGGYDLGLSGRVCLRCKLTLDHDGNVVDWKPSPDGVPRPMS